VRRALIEHGGVVQQVAEAFNVSRQTVYTWINLWGLHNVLDETRQSMFTMAEDNILNAVVAGDLDMSKFVLTHMPVKSSRRWSNRTEVTGADGAPLMLSDDVLKILAAQNLNPSDVVREFERMIREQADAQL
jgi:transposase-like protein